MEVVIGRTSSWWNSTKQTKTKYNQVIQEDIPLWIKRCKTTLYVLEKRITTIIRRNMNMKTLWKTTES